MYEKFYISHLTSAKQSNGQISASCPFHEDHNPSFSVNIITGQYMCHSCRRTGNAFTFAKLKQIPYESVPGYDSQFNKKTSTKEIDFEAIYNYFDERGKLLFQVLKNKNKNFSQRRPNEKEGWIYNLKGINRVPYNLPDVIKSKQILIAEGEKDVETLKKLGYVATTNPGGAGKWRSEYNHHLKDKHLVCFFDNDEVGKNHVKQVVMSNLGNGRCD
jgi:hypothetical protein